MTIQQVIEAAIEGGLREWEKWKFVSANRYWAVWLDGNGTETPIAMEMYFMSPLFWQSLGKAMGWDKKFRLSYEGYCHYDECNTNGEVDEAWGIEEWQYQWHLFIDYLAEGKSAEDFFNTLTN